MPSVTDQDGERRAAKRICVQAACVPCRKRKSKCDGSQLCATCSIHRTTCFYDAESEARRKVTIGTASGPTSTTAATTSRKRPDPKSQERKRGQDAEYIVNALRSLSEAEAQELLQSIRQDQNQPLDLTRLVENWQKSVALPPPAAPEPHTLETDLAILLGKPTITKSGESRHFGHTSSLGLLLEYENDSQSQRSTSVERKPSTWSTVTKDMAFIERMFDLYFEWSHSFFMVFSKSHFLADFYAGRSKYCSSLLVNAILAYACHHSDEEQGRADPANLRTAGNHFFAEARRLLFEDGTPRLTTIQALAVMSLREPSAGRDSTGFMYAGQCMRMAVELGLHVDNDAALALGFSADDVEVRNTTFWGCFTMDSIWSLCMGRIAQLPRAAISTDKPVKYGSASGANLDLIFLQQFSILSELINDNNYVFYAPKERFNSRRLLNIFTKYLDWYKHLPSELGLGEASQPHIIMLHMLYHTILVHLFRPLLKVDLIHSDICPRDMCITSANKVSELFRQYRRHHDLRACHLTLVHYLLSISIVHLLYSTKSEMSARNLVESLQAFEDISVCHYFAARGYRIIHSLAKLWNLSWPEELKSSELLQQVNEEEATTLTDTSSAQPEASTLPHMATRAYDSTKQSPQLLQSQPPNMFGSNQSNPSTLVYPPSNVNTVDTDQRTNYSYVDSSLSTHPFAAHMDARPTTSAQDLASNLFFRIPYTTAPISIKPPTNTMAVDSMLDDADMWDQFGRDGFKMAPEYLVDAGLGGGLTEG